MKPIIFLLACALVLPLSPAVAQSGAFHAGPVFPTFGKIATVDSDLPIPKGTVFKVDFDVSEAAKPGQINRGIESAARFVNMQVEAGVPLDHVHVAIVVHGPAAIDLTNEAVYMARNSGAPNANAPLVAALTGKGVRVYLCGQTAAGMGLKKTDLLPGVMLSLSAMTAHALLQQQGYTLNP